MSTKRIDKFLTVEERLSIVEYATELPWVKDSWGRMTCNIPTGDTENLSYLYGRGMSSVVDFFGVSDIAPTYFKFARYSSRYGIPRVPPHVDENACTYTVDIQLSSTLVWPIYVDTEEHVLSDGDALIYGGEEQLHWRPKFLGQTEEDYVVMLFMHYANTNHWYFTKGPQFMTDSVFHERWKQKMRKMLSSAHHETMTEIDEGIL